MVLLFIISVWDYSYDAIVDVAYDNNVFAYSQDYLDDFVNNVRAYRFPFETYDDMRTHTALDLLVRNKFFGLRTTTVSVHFDATHYLNNKAKDFQKAALGLRQSLGRYAIKLTYDIIPDYLIRYYRDRDRAPTDYTGCTVMYRSLAGKLSYQREPFTMFVTYRYRWDDFDRAFDRYDARNHIVATEVVFRPRKRLTLAVQYAYRHNTNDTARSGAVPDEDVPESSYQQHAPRLSASYWFKLLLPVRLDARYRYTFRRYTADSTDDLFHYGRHDHMHRFDLDIALRMKAGMYLELAYVRRLRTSTSDVFPEIETIKNYDKYVMSAGLRLYH